MSGVLKIGDRIIESEDLCPLLTEYQMLPQLAREIIIEQAIAEIECTPDEKNIARQQFCQQQQITSKEQLEALRKQYWMSPEQLENRIFRGMKVEKFKQSTWGSQIESYFLKRKGQLDRVVYSLIRTQDAGIAQELYFRIQEEESSFVELAKQYSQGSEAQTGGLIGPVELNVIHPKMAQMLNSSKPGQLLPPTRVGDWIVILRLEKFISVQLDEQIRQRLLDERFRAWLQEQFQEKVSLLASESTTLGIKS